MLLCVFLSVPEPLEVDSQPPASSVLPSIFLFFSLFYTERKSQYDAEERLDRPRTMGEVLCPDIHILFLGPKP